MKKTKIIIIEIVLYEFSNPDFNAKSNCDDATKRESNMIK